MKLTANLAVDSFLAYLSLNHSFNIHLIFNPKNISDQIYSVQYG